MAKYVNQSGGLLILSDQTEVPDGAEVDITADGEKTAGVAVWIESGQLVKAKAASKSDDK